MSDVQCTILTVDGVQCKNTFIVTCRHCTVDFCVEHLLQHHQELERTQIQLQLLLNEMLERKSKLEVLEPPVEYEQNRSSLHTQLDQWTVKIRQLIDMNSDHWNQQKARLVTEINDMLAAQRNKLIVDTNDLDSLRKQLSQINNSIEQLTQVPTVFPTFGQIISKMENSELLQNNGN
jgi:hypothetical protein